MKTNFHNTEEWPLIGICKQRYKVLPTISQIFPALTDSNFPNSEVNVRYSLQNSN